MVDIADCLLQPGADTLYRAAFKGWMERFRIPAYDERTGKGLVSDLCFAHQRRGGGAVLRGGQWEKAAL